MDGKYIKPFVNSVCNAMQAMSGSIPRRLEPQVKGDNRARGDISGIVGFAAKNILGSMSLTFPADTAVMAYNKMIGDNVAFITDDVRDLVGELTNFVAGGAKKELADQGLTFDISIPTVVMGESHTLTHKGGTPMVVVPFVLDDSSFIMEISLRIEGESLLAGDTDQAIEAIGA